MRSVSMQFAWLTREEAQRYIARADKTGDSYGDRVAAGRRADPPSPALVARIEENRRWIEEHSLAAVRA